MLSAPPSRPSARLAALANFLTTRSRLSLEMWSMNRTPLRWSISCCRQVARRPVAVELLLLAVEIEIFHPHLRGPRRRPRRIPGSTGSPPRRSPSRPSATAVPGLMKTRGSGGSSFLARSMVTTRRGTPTWIAASPMPGASYMVSNMSSTSLLDLAVDLLHRLGDEPQPLVRQDQDFAQRHGARCKGSGETGQCSAGWGAGGPVPG